MSKREPNKNKYCRVSPLLWSLTLKDSSKGNQIKENKVVEICIISQTKTNLLFISKTGSLLFSFELTSALVKL